MAVERHTFKPTPVACQTCGERTKPLLWDYETPAACPCGGPLARVTDHVDKAHAVIGDEIDRTLEHGLCYADGTPRRFTSRQELQREERRSGWRILEKGEKFHQGRPHAGRR